MQGINEIERVELEWTSAWDNLDVKQSDFSKKIFLRKEYRLMRKHLRYLLNQSAKPKILDAGCGMGLWCEHFKNEGFDVYGVDISRKTIDRLNETSQNIHYSCQDIRKMDFPDEHFDALFSWGVFEHFEEGLHTCIEEAWRVLKPGGFLFITVPYDNFRIQMRALLPLECWGEGYNKSIGVYDYPIRFYQWRFSKNELHRELSRQGFFVSKIVPQSKMAGLAKLMYHELGFPFKSIGNRTGKWLLAAFIPATLVSHMILAVGVKQINKHG